MDIFNKFLDDLKKEIVKLVTQAVNEVKEKEIEPWVTIKEIAEHLGQSESWVNKNLHVIPHIKHDGSKRFKKSAVDQWRIETYGQNYEVSEKQVKVSKPKSSNRGAWKPIE